MNSQQAENQKKARQYKKGAQSAENISGMKQNQNI